MLDDKKNLDRYTAEVAKAIVIIEDKLTRNTITHFENNKVMLTRGLRVILVDKYNTSRRCFRDECESIELLQRLLTH